MRMLREIPRGGPSDNLIQRGTVMLSSQRRSRPALMVLLLFYISSACGAAPLHSVVASGSPVPVSAPAASAIPPRAQTMRTIEGATPQLGFAFRLTNTTVV